MDTNTNDGTKVWIVTKDGPEWSEIVGVYLSEESANASAKDCEQRRLKSQGTFERLSSYVVREYEAAMQPALSGEAAAWDFPVVAQPRYPGDSMREAVWSADEAERMSKRGYSVRALYAAPQVPDGWALDDAAIDRAAEAIWDVCNQSVVSRIACTAFAEAALTAYANTGQKTRHRHTAECPSWPEKCACFVNTGQQSEARSA